MLIKHSLFYLPIRKTELTIYQFTNYFWSLRPFQINRPQNNPLKIFSLLKIKCKLQSIIEKSFSFFPLNDQNSTSKFESAFELLKKKIILCLQFNSYKSHIEVY